MTALGAKLLVVWRKIPRWGKVGYGAGWLLSSLLFSSFYQAAWAPPDRLDLIILWPIVLGAVWPISLLGLIYFLLRG